MCRLLWNTTIPPTPNSHADSAIIGLNQTWDSETCNPSDPYKSSTGANFEVFCNADFSSQDLRLTYARDIYDCASNCANWNLNASNIPCRGASIDVGTYGPSGALGGSECWLKWSASQAPDYVVTPAFSTIAVHSVRLLDTVPAPQYSSPASEGVPKGAVAGITVGVFFVGLFTGPVAYWIFNRVRNIAGRKKSDVSSSSEFRTSGEATPDRLGLSRVVSSSMSEEKMPWRQRPPESQIDH